MEKDEVWPVLQAMLDEGTKEIEETNGDGVVEVLAISLPCRMGLAPEWRRWRAGRSSHAGDHVPGYPGRLSGKRQHCTKKGTDSEGRRRCSGCGGKTTCPSE